MPKEIRITITTQDFWALVAGKEVKKWNSETTIKLILEDMGFPAMRKAIDSTERVKTDESAMTPERVIDHEGTKSVERAVVEASTIITE